MGTNGLSEIRINQTGYMTALPVLVGVLSEGVLYCGDAFTAIWGKPDITPHAASPAAMVRSLGRILELSPEWLATGHGLPAKMAEACPVIKKYLLMNRHRLK